MGCKERSSGIRARKATPKAINNNIRKLIYIMLNCNIGQLLQTHSISTARFINFRRLLKKVNVIITFISLRFIK